MGNRYMKRCSTNITNHQENANQTHNEQTIKVWLPEGKGSGGKLKRVKEVKYMMTEIDSKSLQ